MTPFRNDLIKKLSAVMSTATSGTNAETLACEMLSVVSEDIRLNPKMWPGTLEDNMNEANKLISDCFG